MGAHGRMQRNPGRERKLPREPDGYGDEDNLFSPLIVQVNPTDFRVSSASFQMERLNCTEVWGLAPLQRAEWELGEFYRHATSLSLSDTPWAVARPT